MGWECFPESRPAGAQQKQNSTPAASKNHIKAGQGWVEEGQRWVANAAKDEAEAGRF